MGNVPDQVKILPADIDHPSAEPGPRRVRPRSEVRCQEEKDSGNPVVESKARVVVFPDDVEAVRSERNPGRNVIEQLVVDTELEIGIQPTPFVQAESEELCREVPVGSLCQLVFERE